MRSALGHSTGALTLLCIAGAAVVANGALRPAGWDALLYAHDLDLDLQAGAPPGHALVRRERGAAAPRDARDARDVESEAQAQFEEDSLSWSLAQLGLEADLADAAWLRSGGGLDARAKPLDAAARHFFQGSTSLADWLAEQPSEAALVAEEPGDGDADREERGGEDRDERGEDRDEEGREGPEGREERDGGRRVLREVERHRDGGEGDGEDVGGRGEADERADFVRRLLEAREHRERRDGGTASGSEGEGRDEAEDDSRGSRSEGGDERNQGPSDVAAASGAAGAAEASPPSAPMAADRPPAAAAAAAPARGARAAAEAAAAAEAERRQSQLLAAEQEARLLRRREMDEDEDFESFFESLDALELLANAPTPLQVLDAGLGELSPEALRDLAALAQEHLPPTNGSGAKASGSLLQPASSQDRTAAFARANKTLESFIPAVGKALNKVHTSFKKFMRGPKIASFADLLCKIKPVEACLEKNASELFRKSGMSRVMHKVRMYSWWNPVGWFSLAGGLGNMSAPLQSPAEVGGGEAGIPFIGGIVKRVQGRAEASPIKADDFEDAAEEFWGGHARQMVKVSRTAGHVLVKRYLKQLKTTVQANWRRVGTKELEDANYIEPIVDDMHSIMWEALNLPGLEPARCFTTHLTPNSTYFDEYSKWRIISIAKVISKDMGKFWSEALRLGSSWMMDRLRAFDKESPQLLGAALRSHVSSQTSRFCMKKMVPKQRQVGAYAQSFKAKAFSMTKFQEVQDSLSDPVLPPRAAANAGKEKIEEAELNRLATLSAVTSKVFKGFLYEFQPICIEQLLAPVTNKLVDVMNAMSQSMLYVVTGTIGIIPYAGGPLMHVVGQVLQGLQNYVASRLRLVAHREVQTIFKRFHDQAELFSRAVLRSDDPEAILRKMSHQAFENGIETTVESGDYVGRTFRKEVDTFAETIFKGLDPALSALKPMVLIMWHRLRAILPEIKKDLNQCDEFRQSMLTMFNELKPLRQTLD